EGAQFQRSKAKDELQNLISQQINEAIAQNIDRQPINPTPFGSPPDVGSQLSELLKSYAPQYEQ
ncbi:MAG: competence protein ComFB, partial [Okeania sp. SIO2H7]|nr:competence protein ComFB [Okeania sp. SIO2H7]